MIKKKLTAAERFQEMLAEAKQDDAFHVDGAKLELSEQIFAAMQEIAMSEAELARQLGVSRAYVNKILKGAANLTIESLVKIGRALGRDFKFEFTKPRSAANPRKLTRRSPRKTFTRVGSPAR